MSRITQKLKNQSGASLIISLIFFLTAFMVGTVVLSSATANSDKLIARREERQRYFALSSAARFLRTTIEGTKGEAWKEDTFYECATRDKVFIEPKHQNPPTAYSTNMTITDSDGKIQALLAETAYEMYKINEKLTTGTKPPIIKEFTINVPNKEPDKEPVMEPVKVTLTMEKDYTLTLVLKVQGSGETMTIKVPNAAEKEPTVSTGVATPPECKHLCMEKLDPDGDGITENVEVETEFKITTKRWTTEVEWLTATIAKEVAAP